MSKLTQEDLHHFQDHLHGKKKNRFIDTLSYYVGEVLSILTYGSRHISSTLNERTFSNEHRNYFSPLLRLKEITYLIGSLSLLYFTLTLGGSPIMSILSLVSGLGFIYFGYQVKNPVIFIGNGPDQNTVEYISSGRRQGGRMTHRTFEKLFHLEKMKTADVRFFNESLHGKHDFDASALKKYLMEKQYLLRTFKYAYNNFVSLFDELSSSKTSFPVQLAMNRAVFLTISQSILGFKNLPDEVLCVIMEMEHALTECTEYWEIFGIKIALTESQRYFLRVREEFGKIAPLFLKENRQHLLTNKDNFVYELACEVARIHGNNEKVEDYIDCPEVAHGSLAMMLAAGNPATHCLGTWYLLNDYPVETSNVNKELTIVYNDAQQLATVNQKSLLENLYDQIKTGSSNTILNRYYNESLRYVSPANTIVRYCSYQQKINNVLLPEGSVLVTNIRSVLHDPKHWQSPDQFNPDRFSEHNYSLHQYPYIPFSSGERRCPGALSARCIFFAFLLAYLGNYELIPDDQYPQFVLPKGKAICRASHVHRAFLKKLRDPFKLQ